MNDAFAAKTYPTILYVLDLLERIESGKVDVRPADEKPRLKQYLGQLETRGEDQSELDLARTALVYWIDEVLINANWVHAGEWKNDTLEREYFTGRIRARDFFDKASVAGRLSRTDALETFFLCVALGFVGAYRNGGGPAPMPTPKPVPAAPPAPAKGGSDQVSWFNDANPVPSGSEETWGLGGLPSPNKPAPSKPEPPAPPPVARQAGHQSGLPPTLREWAAPVHAQIAPGTLRPFAPSAPSGSPRDARPLRGYGGFLGATGLAIMVGLLTVILLVVRMMV
ncbi:hypothetical protein Pan216_23860 [Planctomycetes bacterium Pan216]|uniref:Type IV / VI secretion system DotU domain-containing protein n=1 Tax=Kolteria novifilia TaxID=2527975 RepID=A0A518B3H4_9BACT|nr:hypothetical protein Pan216_23860 [Planctomycetes bacterium Pan216]